MSTININVSKTDMGLDQVDNTSDLNKPISTATQTALDNKVDKVTGSRLITSSESTLLGNTSGTNTGDETVTTIKSKLGITTLSGSNTGDQDLSSLAPLASPTFTGTVTLPSDTNIGTVTATELGYLDGVTQGIQAQINAKVNLNTLITPGTGTKVTYDAKGLILSSTNITTSDVSGLGTLATQSTIPVVIQLACSDETTALTAGTSKVTFRMPHEMTLIAVRASLNVAGTTSGITTIDINEGGTSILSTKLTIDLTEKTSTTAATPAVISDSSLADDAEITIDIDAISGGATEKGLKITLIGTRAV